MADTQVAATGLIFGVCGVYIFITIVILLKYCIHYIKNRSELDEEEDPSRWRRHVIGPNAQPSFIYGVQANRRTQPVIEPPPAFEAALSCPSPNQNKSVFYIEVDDELPSYSDYERLCASNKVKGQPELVFDFNTKNVKP